MESTLEMQTTEELTALLSSLGEGDSIVITLGQGQQNISALRAIVENVLYKNFCGGRSEIQSIAMRGMPLPTERKIVARFNKHVPAVIGPEWVAERIRGHVRIEKIAA